MDEQLTGDQRAPGLTRRRIVKTAGTAAWAAPVIVVATSAPAYAGSGAAVITTSQPSFTPVFDRIRASSRITNVGTVAPASMLVTATISPLVGTLRPDKTKLITKSGFALVSESVNPTTGQQTLTYMKVDPQLAPSTTVEFTLDFFQDSGAAEVRSGTFTVSPSVPAPGTATPNTDDYLSIGEPPS